MCDISTSATSEEFMVAGLDTGLDAGLDTGLDSGMVRIVTGERYFNTIERYC